MSVTNIPTEQICPIETDSCLVSHIPKLHETRRFTTVSIKACHWTFRWTSWSRSKGLDKIFCSKKKLLNMCQLFTLT